MSLILNIETATNVGSVCLSRNGQPLWFKESLEQKEHASFVHSAVLAAMSDCRIALQDVDAFAVTSGPGSYTGLRVSMAAAKGFCYALSKPLILLNTLEVMAQAALSQLEGIKDGILLCPMIDARRMEVFRAVYDENLVEVVEPAPVVLDENYLKDIHPGREMYFFGNGSNKFKEMTGRRQGLFPEVTYNASHLALLSEKLYAEKVFSDVSYSEPRYYKEFYTVAK